MSGSQLYDDDILLWSEEQARIIRGLGSRRLNLPNEFDAENVAEEIESVGRSELAAVEGQLQNVILHLIKIATEPDSPALRHGRAEIAAFHAEIRRRYAPSMRQRIDMEQLWSTARELSLIAAEQSGELEAILPKRSPFNLEQFMVDRVDPAALALTISREPYHAS